MIIEVLVAAAFMGAPVEPQETGAAVAGPFDSAVDRRGRFYVTEGDRLIRLAPRGRRATVASFPSRMVPGPHHTVASAGLTAPSGLTIRGDAAYVTTCGDCAGDGNVRRIPLPSQP